MGTKSKQIKTNGKKTHRNQKIPIKCVRCKESFFVKVNPYRLHGLEKWKKKYERIIPIFI